MNRHLTDPDRRADGAKSNAAAVAMSSSTILFKTAITNCRALLLYDDGWGRHAIEDYEEGWGGRHVRNTIGVLLGA